MDASLAEPATSLAEPATPTPVAEPTTAGALKRDLDEEQELNEDAKRLRGEASQPLPADDASTQPIVAAAGQVGARPMLWCHHRL